MNGVYKKKFGNSLVKLTVLGLHTRGERECG